MMWFRKSLSFVLNRCLWLYLIIILVVFKLSIPYAAITNRLNQLKGVERVLKDFELGGPFPSPEIFKEGVKYYELLKHHVDDSLVYGNLGFCHFYLGNYQEALNAYRQAILIEPNLYFYYWDIGLIYYYLQDYEKSRLFFDNALAYIPGVLEYYEGLKNELLSSHDQKMQGYLLADYRRLVEDREEAFVKIAQDYQEIHDFSKMRETSLNGLTFFPESPQLYYYAGLARFLQGDYQDALKDFNQALVRDSSDVRFHYYRGLCFEKTGNKLGYIVEFNKAAALGGRDLKGEQALATLDRLHLNTELLALRYFRQRNRLKR